MFLNMTAAARDATRKDFLTFLQEKIDIKQIDVLYEQGVNKRRLLLEPQVQKISKALSEAKELSQQPLNRVNVEKLNQVNKQISEDIPTAFPSEVTLEWIQSYCEDRSNMLNQNIRDQRKGLGKTLRIVIITFTVCFICFLLGTFAFFFSIRILSIVITGLGSFCTIVGMVLLRNVYVQTGNINKEVEKHDLLNKLETTQLLIEQITDDNSKNAILRKLFESILVLNIKPGKKTSLASPSSQKKASPTSLKSTTDFLEKFFDGVTPESDPFTNYSDRSKDLSQFL